MELHYNQTRIISEKEYVGTVVDIKENKFLASIIEITDTSGIFQNPDVAVFNTKEAAIDFIESIWNKLDS